MKYLMLAMPIFSALVAIAPATRPPHPTEVRTLNERSLARYQAWRYRMERERQHQMHLAMRSSMQPATQRARANTRPIAKGDSKTF